MKPPVILVTGVTGQVGYELVRSLTTLGRVVAPPHAVLDLADPDAVRCAVRELRPAVIVNAAAYTAVDRAEGDAEVAEAVNARAPRVFAEEADALGSVLVHFSTDYVFDGGATRPYTERDTPGPRNVYGATKLAGERAVAAVGGRHLILRTGWVYGGRGRNFLDTMLRMAAAGRQLRVVDDQRGAPTPSRLLAQVVAAVLRDPRVAGRADDAPWGTYHVSAAGETSWYGFACAIFREVCRRGGTMPALEAIPTSGYPTPAARPAYSVLDTALIRSTFALHLPTWEEQLPLVLDERLAAQPVPPA